MHHAIETNLTKEQSLERQTIFKVSSHPAQHDNWNPNTTMLIKLRVPLARNLYAKLKQKTVGTRTLIMPGQFIKRRKW